jgi:hypothetical protein
LQGGNVPGRAFDEVKAGYADRLVHDSRFEVPSTGIDHDRRRRRIHIFRYPGDQIEGLLIAGPMANSRRNASYIVETDDGEEIEFYGNKQLHAILPDLRGKFIRIVYVGWQRLPRCKKPRKVYRVFQQQGLGLLAPKREEEQPGSGGDAVADPDEDRERDG